MKRELAALIALALIGFGCKKSGQTAAKPAEPPPQNAATQYANDLANDVKRAQAVQEKQNAAIRQTSQAVGEAGADPGAAGN